MSKYLFVLVFAALTLCVACDSCEVGEDGGCARLPATDTDTAVDHEVVDNDTASPYQTAISACGGFGDAAVSTKADTGINETLEWSYDAGTGEVTVTNRNICINCCGDHSIEANAVDGGYGVTEVDMKQDGSLRCKCNCLFDYRITLPGPVDGQLTLDLKRLIEESGTSAVWNGTLQLESMTGSILIKEQSNCI